MRKRIGIGLLVWNGGKTIKKAIDSLLKQTYQNFDLIILDNKSTDGTVAIINQIIKKNKTKIKIQLIQDYKKRNLVNAQKYLAKKYLRSYKYISIISDDDLYHPQFMRTLITKIINEKLSLVYCNYNLVSSDNKFLKTKDYPTYNQSSTFFFNLIKFIIYRNMVPVFFGIFLSEKYINSLKYFVYYDKTQSNFDTLFLTHFLINNKVGYVKKILFSYRQKNRYEIQKSRKHNVFLFNELKTCFLIFFYQYNLSKKLIQIVFENKELNLIKKNLVFLLILIISAQKSVSFIIRKIYNIF